MNISEVTFDPIKHCYTRNGVSLVSVTTVCKEVVDGAHYTQEARDRGTAVHVACQLWDENDLDESSVAPEIRPYLDAYIKFMEQTDGAWDLIERPMCEPFREYAGTPDRVLWEKCVLDIKTGSYEPWHALQAAAYTSMLPDALKYRRLALYLSNNGTYVVREFPKSEYMQDLTVFLSLLNVLNWKRRTNGSR